MLAESRFFRDLICYDFCWCGCPNIMPSSATLWRQSTRGYTLWTPSPLFTPADTSSVLLHTSTVMMQQKSSAIKVNESRSSRQRLSSHWRHNQWTSCLKTVVFLSDVIPLYRLCGRCSVAVASTGTLGICILLSLAMEPLVLVVEYFLRYKANNSSIDIFQFSHLCCCP